MNKLTIIDYGINNIKSIVNALEYLNIKYSITNNAKDIEKSNQLLLPGIGHFGQAMKHLSEKSIDEVIKFKVLEEKTPILGICLGMQLLATFSEEDNLENKGLDFINGEIKHLNPFDPNLRVPHYGWTGLNNIKKDSILFKDIDETADFYFVHSYSFIGDKKYISSTYDYSYEVTASIEKENIFGVQFHPEKSKKNGLKILSNFMEYYNG